ncbi:hypothetical protein [Nocardia sp. NPDC056100]|uniref:hypothetical protein n=1 Tax=Nocardia sp. NPDC056100 TaxID=3345712 RepID=UPI0035E29147
MTNLSRIVEPALLELASLKAAMTETERVRLASRLSAIEQVLLGLAAVLPSDPRMN